MKTKAASKEPSLLERVRHAIADSQFVKAVTSARAGVDFAVPGSLRPLTEEEVQQLRRQGNWAEDWGRVRVAAADFQPSRIHQCSFHGQVVLGSFVESLEVDEIAVPSGLWNSTLSDCVVGSNTLIRDVRWLARYVIKERAVLIDCGCVACDKTTRFGNGIEICLGVETGGREVAIFADIDFDIAVEVTTSRSDKEQLAEYSSAIKGYSAAVESERGIVLEHAVIRQVNTLHNTFVGEGARLEGAQLIQDCTLLSSVEEPVEIGSGSVYYRVGCTLGKSRHQSGNRGSLRAPGAFPYRTSRQGV